MKSIIKGLVFIFILFTLYRVGVWYGIVGHLTPSLLMMKIKNGDKEALNSLIELGLEAQTLPLPTSIEKRVEILQAIAYLHDYYRFNAKEKQNYEDWVLQPTTMWIAESSDLKNSMKAAAKEDTLWELKKQYCLAIREILITDFVMTDQKNVDSGIESNWKDSKEYCTDVISSFDISPNGVAISWLLVEYFGLRDASVKNLSPATLAVLADVRTYRIRYFKENQDIRKTALKEERNSSINSNFSYLSHCCKEGLQALPVFVGTISHIGDAIGSDGVNVDFAIGSEVTLATVIHKGHSAWDAILNSNVGDKVAFSTVHFDANDEGSFTETGNMTAPEFRVTLKTLRKL